eukprot:m.200308 g.200308  ORF g.200308 m.200308 type:complete len:140 (-) comp13708_c3_seq1:129-548(-)
MPSSPFVSLELVFKLSKLFVFLWFIVEILLFIWKANVLPYSSSDLATEIVLVAITALLELFRLSLGRRGNLTQERRFLVASLLVALPSILGFVYLFLWQSYVLRIEFGLCIVAFILHGLALVLIITALVVFTQGRYYKR